MAGERRPRREEFKSTPSQPVTVTDVRLEQVGRSGDRLKGRIAATAKKGGQPWSGADISFKVGGVQTPNSPLQSGDDGTANDDFDIPLDPATSRVLIEAWFTGSNPARKFLDIATATKPSAPKKIDKLAVNATGNKNGQWVVSVMASTQDNQPVEGVEVIFLYNGESKPETLTKGVASHTILVTGKSCEVVVQAPGIEPKTLRLAGPKEKIKVPPVPEEVKTWWQKTKAAWNMAAEDSKKEKER
ncbi:MAG: hypothetical protein Q8Q95_03590 [bacterium]|nr:hypothetical protein [bacterium]